MPNSFTIKIIGTAELPEPLEMGYDYSIGAKLSIPEIAKQDNEDGTFTYQHKGKLQLIGVTNKLGKTVKGTAKGSKSQVLRYRIMERGDEEYYQKVMDTLINNLDWLLDTVLKDLK